MDDRREMREMRRERGPRLAFGTAVRIQHRRHRSARAVGAIDEARDVTVCCRDAQQLRLDELGAGHAERRREGDASVAGRDVERPHLPRLGRGDPRERGSRSIGAQHQVLADAAELALPHLATALPPPQARVPVLVHRPDLRAPIRRRHSELDVPVRMVDRLTASVLRIERREPQMLAALVRDLEHAAVVEPTSWNVLHVVLLPRDVARLTGARIDDEELLVGVVEHAHDEQLRAVRRPSTGDVPRRAGDELPFGSGVEVRDDDVHVRRRARVARERDAPSVRRRRVPRHQPLHLTGGIDGDRGNRTIGVADVQLVELSAAAIGRGQQLATRAPAQTADGVIGDCHRALSATAARGDRPRLVRAGALVRHDREGPAIGGQRERGAAGKAACRMGHAREPFARMKVRQTPLGHGPLRYR